MLLSDMTKNEEYSASHHLGLQEIFIDIFHGISLKGSSEYTNISRLLVLVQSRLFLMFPMGR